MAAAAGVPKLAAHARWVLADEDRAGELDEAMRQWLVTDYALAALACEAVAATAPPQVSQLSRPDHVADTASGRNSCTTSMIPTMCWLNSSNSSAGTHSSRMSLPPTCRTG